MVLSMAPLHSLCHNDQNEVKHDFVSHVMPLVPGLLSCDAKCISNGIILFTRWRQLKQGVIGSFGHVMLLLPVWASHETDGIVDGIILFARSRWLKQGTTWLSGHVMPVFVSYDTDGIINTTFSLVSSKLIKMTCNITFESFDNVGLASEWHFQQWHCQ